MLLSTVTTMILYMIFLTFWASFLIEESVVCDRQLDCFFTRSLFSVSYRVEYIDCSEVGNSTTTCSYFISGYRVDDCSRVGNYTVTCFRFVLAATKGFAHRGLIKHLLLLSIYCYYNDDFIVNLTFD